MTVGAAIGEAEHRERNVGPNHGQLVTDLDAFVGERVAEHQTPCFERVVASFVSGQEASRRGAEQCQVDRCAVGGAGVEERQTDRGRVVSEAVLPGFELVGTEAGPAELRARPVLERQVGQRESSQPGYAVVDEAGRQARQQARQKRHQGDDRTDEREAATGDKEISQGEVHGRTFQR